MKKNIADLTLILIAVIFSVSPLSAAEKFNSSTNPAAIGTHVPSMIELGSVNSSIYDTTITVLEVIRDEAAMKLLKKASAKNSSHSKGLEYVLVRIKFELKGRAVSDTMSMGIGDEPLQWVALTSELTDYPQVSVIVPKPALAGKVKANESIEGWVAFAVERNDKKPVMVFDPDSGGATGRGRALFFKLYSVVSG